ncbi:unnamed protein product [Bursaphelenchus okinawaensis]|uniref:Major sperm protein n=1 Tax=Bursaphelenchus okinawaensis TaxID=465554 RepID=A0A811LBJ5_9BILA|nr:unnamed protein product [Bursaphelenchus okinawaensis]CAG9120307.1 unnamed protein product [Bursaphelenchus okinawaensis]
MSSQREVDERSQRTQVSERPLRDENKNNSNSERSARLQLSNSGRSPSQGSLVGKAKQPKTQLSQKRAPKSHKTPATQLRFVTIHGRPDVARVQLLLSNISDRSLFFKLKSNVGSNVSALPAGQGHVAARGSTRCVLTWHRPKKCQSWDEVDPPKLLLVTRFLDSNNNMTKDQTSTRLLAHVASKGTCPATNPPVEQFLLDAVNQRTSQESMDATEVSIQKQPAEDEKNPMTEFVVSLTSDQMNWLLVFLALFFLGLYNTISTNKSK